MNKGNLLDEIQLLVTDLDGTLLGPKPEFKFYNAFRDIIAELRHDPDFKWVICTGRSLASYRHIFLPLRSFGLVPDYVITRHAYIYQRLTWGFYPHLIWNLRIRELQWRHRIRMNYALPRLRKVLARHVPFARVGALDSVHISFKFDDEDVTNTAVKVLTEAIRPYHYLQVFQFHNEVVVHMVPFTKGLSLAELARKIEVSTNRILSVGEGHNDISMMDPAVAGHCACPVNAAPEVIEHVHSHGGHIASTPCLEGVIEILNSYAAGSISNALPADWTHPSEQDRPASLNRLQHHKKPSKWQSGLIIIAVIYTTLLVFATFGLLPGSGLIRKPFLMLVEAIRKLLGV